MEVLLSLDGLEDLDALRNDCGEVGLVLRIRCRHGRGGRWWRFCGGGGELERRRKRKWGKTAESVREMLAAVTQ